MDNKYIKVDKTPRHVMPNFYKSH